MDVRIECHVGPWCRIVLAQRLQHRLGVHAGQLRRQRLERVRLLLGDARDAVFLAQQVHDLLVEDLPGEQARLLHHLMAVLGIGVAVEVEPLVEEALAARVHQHAEWIVVLLEPIADREVAIGRRIHVPLHGMCARPVARHRGADVDRHAVAGAGVVFGAAHLGQIPVGPEIARAHFRIRFEPAAGEHHRLGAQIVLPEPVPDAHAVDARIAAQQRRRCRLVQHRNAECATVRARSAQDVGRRQGYGTPGRPRT